MNALPESTVVIVPGLRDHVADHWQSLLADTLWKVAIVPPLERDGLSLAARVAALDAVLADIDGPVVLVAHSAGVMITVHWAQQSDRPVLGALLATPPDFETPLPQGYPTAEELTANGWTPIPRRRLPFPSIVAASSTDPWPRLAASPAWPRCGGADWSTSATSDISIRRQATDRGRVPRSCSTNCWTRRYLSAEHVHRAAARNPSPRHRSRGADDLLAAAENLRSPARPRRRSAHRADLRRTHRRPNLGLTRPRSTRTSLTGRVYRLAE